MIIIKTVATKSSSSPASGRPDRREAWTIKLTDDTPQLRQTSDKDVYY